MTDPQAEIPTNDPCITIAPDLSEIVLDVSKIQPKLHKRTTANIKKRQLDYILMETGRIFATVYTV